MSSRRADTGVRALGATTANPATQRNYVSNPSDSLSTGVDSLIDANMIEAATKLAALEVQQQAAAPALKTSDMNLHLVLKLFER